MPPEQKARRARTGSQPDPYADLLRNARQRKGGRAYQRRQRKRVIRLTVIAVIGAIVVGLLLAPGVRNLLWGGSAPSDGGGTTLASQPSSVGTTAKGAFADTPAAHFPSGASGILPPPGRKLGAFSAADVDKVTALTKQALMASRLDPKMVQEGNLSGYVSKLAPSLRPMITSQVAKGNGALGYVTRLAPTARLAAEPIRVSGTMEVSLGNEKQLVVSADYVWVYALKRISGPKPADEQPPGASLVVLHTVETYEWYQPSKVAKNDRGLRTGGGELNAYNKDCTQFNRGFLALEPLAADGHGTAPAKDAYNPKMDPGQYLGSC